MTGDEGGDVWRDRIDELWQVFRRAVGRVADDRRPAPGWTPDRATDWIWARVQPSSFAHLVDERGWTPDAYPELTVGSLMADMVRPAGG